jgi:hypothetical protein
MPKATSLHDCRRFAETVASVGGRLPDELGHYLLSAFELLSSPGAAASPEKAILDAALDGTLTAKKLDGLLAAAATAQMINVYRGDLARRAEHTLVGTWHQAMETAADAILDSVRPQFDKAAAGIARARAAISMDSSPEHVLASAEPEAITEWQALPTYLGVVDRIGTHIAAQFGPRLGMFPMIREYPGANGHLLEDRALFATDGGLLVDSSMFRRPGAHRQSPWVRVGALKLHSVASARRRYNDWAADQWDVQHSGPRGGQLIDGKIVLDEVPPNPYRAQQLSVR